MNGKQMRRMADAAELVPPETDAPATMDAGAETRAMARRLLELVPGERSLARRTQLEILAGQLARLYDAPVMAMVPHPHR